MRIKLFIFSGILFLSIMLLSWNPKSAPASLPGNYDDTIRDIDGNEIYTVIIGKQEWTVQNLSTVHFRNGDTIQQAITAEDWVKAWTEKRPAWCYYDGNKQISKFIGKLYNFYAITDPRGIAPKGWRIPLQKDWDEMITTLGGHDLAGPRLRFPYGWKDDNTGTNSSRFRALPGGYRDQKGLFYNFYKMANWWNEPDTKDSLPSCIELLSGSIPPMRTESKLLLGYGISIRCVKE